MATRRARIQIKPNTGPRNIGRDSGTDKTPATPPKQPAQSQTKAPTPKPSQLPPTQDDTKSAPQVAVLPSITKPSAPIYTKPPGPLSATKTPTPSGTTKTSTPATSTKTTTSVASTEAPVPSNSTKTSDGLPVAPKEPEASTSKASQISGDGSSLAVEVFKKPEVPSRLNQITKQREILSAPADVTDSSTLQFAIVPVKKNTRKTKKGDGEGKRNTPKHLAAFKQNEPPDRTKMTIMDLIHWNPIQNPMKKSNETVKASSSQSSPESSPTSERLSQEAAPNKPTEETEDYIPGPRVIVGEDGQIMLDETSLVIEQTAPEQDLSQEVVYETSDTTYSSYSKKIISRQFWTMKETAMFYKALSVVGTDFALMAKFFPKRTRADLKRKFKKEERFRRDLLDKAITEWHKFDLEDIQDFLFCKETQPVDEQREEEARVDNPDDPSEAPQPNNYVRDNLLNMLPKRRGRPPGQGNKSKTDKVNEAQSKKNKKTKKRPASRNAWSDEEAEPIGSEDELIICDDNEEPEKCQDHQNEVCDCCQMKTKTSKRQHSLEAKKLKMQELEQQRQKHMQATFAPVREFIQSESPKQLSDTVSFTVLANKSVSSPIYASPSSTPSNAPTALTPRIGTILTPVHKTQGTPKAITLISNQNTPQNISKLIVPGRSTPSTSSDVSLATTSNSLTTSLATTSKSLTTPTVDNMKKNTPETITVISDQPTPPSVGKVVVANRSVLKQKPVNVVNVNKPGAASPLLQALLNRVPQNTPGGAPSQFILVADKTPNNEQVLHVYLVSPNNTQSSSTATTSANGVQINTDTLQRLGIRPIVQQQPETQRMQDVPEQKT